VDRLKGMEDSASANPAKKQFGPKVDMAARRIKVCDEAVSYVFKVHQFVGGFDKETQAAFGRLTERLSTEMGL
jgi:hypothetical protein